MYHQFSIHNSNLGKIINIRLRWLTLCFVPTFIFCLSMANGRLVYNARFWAHIIWAVWRTALCVIAQTDHIISIVLFHLMNTENRKTNSSYFHRESHHWKWKTWCYINWCYIWRHFYVKLCLWIVCHLTELLIKRITFTPIILLATETSRFEKLINLFDAVLASTTKQRSES